MIIRIDENTPEGYLRILFKESDRYMHMFEDDPEDQRFLALAYALGQHRGAVGFTAKEAEDLYLHYLLKPALDQLIDEGKEEDGKYRWIDSIERRNDVKVENSV